MKKIHYSSVFSLLLMAIMFTVTSCQKEDIQTPVSEEGIEQFQFSKIVAVSDASGDNLVEIKVASNDEATLSNYSPANFEITPIAEGENPADVLGQSDNEVELDTSTPEEEVNTEPNVAFQMVSKILAPGIKQVAVTFKNVGNENDRGWSYSYHYSNIGQETAFIQRKNIWHRVYFRLHYMATSSSSYAPIVSDFRKLSNKQIFDDSKANCHRFRFNVKHKGIHTYTVLFS